MADLKLLESFPSKRKVTDKTWDEQAREYLKKLNGLPPSVWTKPIDKKSILDTLNPSTHTIPYLFALNHLAQNIGKEKSRAEEWINYATLFFTSFDPIQVRYVDAQWFHAVETSFDVLRGLNIRDYTPIVTGMLRLDPTAGTFTTNHLRVLRACLSIGCPSQALPLLDKDIYAFPQKPVKNMPEELLNEESDFSNAYIIDGSAIAGKVKPEHVLEYYLLGAQVYIGLRNYTRARLFLEYVILSPSPGHGSSAFQMEAYKKWILLGLVSEGRRFPLPRTHDQQVLKALRATSKPYEALADDFEKRDHLKFNAEMYEGSKLWEEDGNARFVREAWGALQRFRVIDLQKTYAALPISHVAALLEVPLAGVQQTLTEMIRAGQLNASLTPSPTSSGNDAVLRFHQTPSASNKPTTNNPADSLEAQTKRIEALVASIKDADRRLRLTNEFVAHERRTKRSGAVGGMDADLAEQMDLTWDAPPPAGGTVGEDLDDEGDEDIMAG